MFWAAGSRITFGSGEDSERLIKGRNQSYYTINLVVSEKNGLKKTELREYVAQGIRNCFALLRDKAVKADEVKDVAKLDADFEQGMAQFFTLPLPELPKYWTTSEAKAARTWIRTGVQAAMKIAESD